MKRFSAALVALSLLSTPAMAYGTVITLPILEFPGDTGTVSSQGCEAPVSETAKCK